MNLGFDFIVGLDVPEDSSSSRTVEAIPGLVLLRYGPNVILTRNVPYSAHSWRYLSFQGFRIANLHLI